MMEDKVRIDKWLWAVRIYKKRSQAAIACNSGKVKIEGESVKASKQIGIGEIINIQKDALKLTFKVIGLVEKRVSAKLVSNYVEELTPEEELMKHKEFMKSAFYRPKGLGRPTKKERRIIDKYQNEE